MQDPAGAFGLVATADGGNTEPSQPAIFRLPSFYALKDQYGTVAATVMPATTLPAGGPNRVPLTCQKLSDPVRKQLVLVWAVSARYIHI